MKLHRIAARYPSDHQVMTWCGLWVNPDRIVKPSDVGTDRECKNCRKAHDASIARAADYFSVSATR